MKSKTITTTRFNTDTFHQNRQYVQKTGIKGCIYGTPMKIKDIIPMESSVYVIEMNNDINKIEGIGLINNRLILDKNYRIYKDMDYNSVTSTEDNVWTTYDQYLLPRMVYFSVAFEF